MDCENYEALVVDLLYGDLSPERRAEAASHAASCAECGKLSKELDEARAIAASLPARLAPPRELDERVMLAARAAADVRAHPWRGSIFHVAAAAVLAALLVGVSFAVGEKVGSKKGLPEDDRVLSKRPTPSTTDIGDRLPGGPPRGPNDLESWRAYMEQMLKLANENFAKGDVKGALMHYRGVYASGGRTAMALEGRIGMAKCLRSLGQLSEARDCARDAFAKNDEWGTHFPEIDDEAMKLIREIGQQLSTENPH